MSLAILQAMQTSLPAALALSVLLVFIAGTILLLLRSIAGGTWQI
jgi:hypothetical protein